MDANGAWVMDLGSANGTQVNGKKIERQAVRLGDVVGVGGARIHIEELMRSPKSAGETQRVDPEAVAEEDEEDLGSIGLETMHGAEKRDRDNVRVFARITRALVQETELLPLLKLIVDSAVVLVGGERGFLLLRSSDQTGTLYDPRDLKVRVARTFDRSDIPIPASRLSMGIAERVIQGGRPLLSVDAGKDDRFSGMASVEDLRLRSVMCLPIGNEGRVEGLLYVDNRLQKGAFTQDDLDLAELLADQAAIAINNARLVSELRERNERLVRSSDRIRSLNDQLGRKIRDRDSELAVVRAELGRERGRYDYGSMVGASDEMKRVFNELDRIIETELPVFIHGESGTGKELIARADSLSTAPGPKNARSWYKNCSALQRTTCWRARFSGTRSGSIHRSGQRSRKGLFEVSRRRARFFLDEIGDMSPALQKSSCCGCFRRATFTPAGRQP